MYTIGVDLGGTNIKVGICDESLKIVAQGSVPTLAQRCGEDIIKDMADLSKKLMDETGASLEDIEYVGIATPGIANTKTGTVEFSANLPFKNFPIAKVYKSFLPVKEVYVANDANAAALGEALIGAGKGAQVAFMITLGTGVGSGIIIDGKIFAGGINCGGAELGHKVIMVGGRQCGCGRRGCWEAYASANALIAMTNEKMHELRIKGIPSLLFEEAENEGKVSAKTAFEASKRGDKYAKELVDNYVIYLASGIADLVNGFQPEVVIIGGGVSKQGDYLINPLREIVDKEQYTRNNEIKTKIVCATLGNDAGIIGAAALGR